MRLDVIRRIDKGDLQRSGEELPKWLDALITPINLFIENVVNALRGRLTFADNFLCNVRTLTFTSGTELEINPRKTDSSQTLRAIGVFPIYCSSGNIDKFGWTQKNNGNIGVTVTSDAGGSIDVGIVILLG